MYCLWPCCLQIEAGLIDIQKNLMETQKEWWKLNEEKKKSSLSMTELSDSIEVQLNFGHQS